MARSPKPAFEPGSGWRNVDVEITHDEPRRAPQNDTQPQTPPPPKVRAPKAEKAPKQKLPLPPDAILPQHGWPWLMFKLAQLTNKPDPDRPDFLYVPALGKKDRGLKRAEEQRQAYQAAVDARLAYREELIERLRFLAGLGINPIISFANIKSAGKTSDAIYVGSAIAEYTRKFVVVVPSTNNTATSTLAMMAGINEGNLITARQFYENLAEFGAYRAISERMPRTTYGLGVLCEDTNDVSNINQTLSDIKFNNLVRQLLPHVDFLILDHGNDNIEVGSIALEATRLSHVVNFAFKAEDEVSIGTLRKTIAGYNTDEKPPTTPCDLPEDTPEEVKQSVGQLRQDPEFLQQTGVAIPTREKVQSSIVIANLARPGERYDYQELTRPQQGAKRPPVPPWNGVGLSLPQDPQIGQAAKGQVNTCDLSKIAPITHEAVLEIAVANLETAAKAMGINLKEKGYDHEPIRRGYDTQHPDAPFDI